ncbi:hypothetical protein SEA_SKOG_25 [Gordonia phage Skog]|uniref:Uncharacterized protein n=1 Tax=Gordonia phage Skog TaxID=2704033 RepID=A0A6G6XJD3_9CAUD|nr:hypothetical protein KHQ85_gp025 [Gordonia phage Skog]QIG58177.1 hypothetical protein SEA_SKOG_25 [Gordonia phage Skog]
MTVRCGNRVHQAEIVDAQGHHHDTVAQVKLCFARPHGLKSLEEVAFDAVDDANWEAAAEAERLSDARFENDVLATWEADLLRDFGIA